MQRTHHMRILVVVLGLFALAPVVETAEAVTLQSWDKQIPNADKRFRVLPRFNNEAVLDRETQLVWERSPSAGGPFLSNCSWFNAVFMCYSKTVGGRLGWRLPTVEELASLLDPSVTGTGPTLPDGHPFSNIQFFYWSATTSPGNPNDGMGVHFVLGVVAPINKPGVGVENAEAWCVRGGHGHDGGH